jgi:hypothetical protein
MALEADHFQPYIDGSCKRKTAAQHPHSGVTAELRRVAESGSTEVVQILAPPGYLKTRVLRDLEKDLRAAQRFKCVSIEAHVAGDANTFWQGIAECLKQEGIDVARPSHNDYYWVVRNALRGRSCVLIIENADSWLVHKQTSFDEAAQWLARLHNVGCLVIVAGFIDLYFLNLITGGGKHSPVPLRSLPVAWNDQWENWTSALCADHGLSKRQTKTELEPLASRHPLAYLEGVQASGRGDDGGAAVRGHHALIGREILDRVSPTLRAMLTGSRLEKLNRNSREVDMLSRSLILTTNGMTVQPAIADWGDVWRSYAESGGDE